MDLGALDGCKGCCQSSEILSSLYPCFAQGLDKSTSAASNAPCRLHPSQSVPCKTAVELLPLLTNFYNQQLRSCYSKHLQRYGIWGDWDQPYLTLKPEYEAAQIGVFGKMVLNGHIYRGKKPVHWSPSSQTALAEAELEVRIGTPQHLVHIFSEFESRQCNRQHLGVTNVQAQSLAFVSHSGCWE